MGVEHVHFEMADSRSKVLDVWGQAFIDLDANFHLRRSRRDDPLPACDAIALPVVLAHERYGGMPIIGRSQVLEVTDEPKHRWAVTTVPFPARLRRVMGEADTEPRWAVVKAEGFDAKRTSHLVFRGMLRAIEDHNEIAESGKITTLAIDLDEIGMSEDRAEEEAASAAEAASLALGSSFRAWAGRTLRAESIISAQQGADTHDLFEEEIVKIPLFEPDYWYGRIFLTSAFRADLKRYGLPAADIVKDALDSNAVRSKISTTSTSSGGLRYRFAHQRRDYDIVMAVDAVREYASFYEIIRVHSSD